MKLLMIVLMLLVASTAHATYYQLESCKYEYLPEFGSSKYIGIYKSQFGNRFVMYFDTWCPAVVNQ